jgi:hypothetical protein
MNYLNRVRSLTIAFGLLCFQGSSTALAGVSFGVSGAWAKNHLGLETHTMQMGKATMSVDLGSYLRLGYSFAQILQHREGYENQAEEGEDPSYIYFEQDVAQNSHSVDLFAILYAGSVLTPYVFAGGAMKYYKIYTEKEGKEPTMDEDSAPSPNWGVGLSISISKNFSIKLSNTWSLGMSKSIDGEMKSERDSQLEVGVTYAIR